MRLPGSCRAAPLAFVVLLVVLLVAFSRSSHSEAPEDVSGSLDRYLSARTELGRFSGAVLVAKGERILFRKGFGFADVDRRIPYTPETRHAVASITKMFTSMAALKLRDAGRLRLDDSVCSHIAACPAAWKPITVQHLMRHTSGIPDYEETFEFGSEKYLAVLTQEGASRRVIEEAKKKPLDFPPGTKFHYSNTGYLVLACIVEAAAERPFDDFVTEQLLRPARMARAGMFDGKTVPEGLATGYTHPELGWAKLLAGAPLAAGHLVPRPRLPLTPPAGDAGLYATLAPADFARLEGVYAMADGRRLTVRKGGDLLEAELEGRYTAGLVPLSPTRFYFPLGDGTATFVEGENGRAVSVNIRYSAEDHVATRTVPGASP